MYNFTDSHAYFKYYQIVHLPVPSKTTASTKCQMIKLAICKPPGSQNFTEMLGCGWVRVGISLKSENIKYKGQEK